jgi:hypothetical protein
MLNMMSYDDARLQTVSRVKADTPNLEAEVVEACLMAGKTTLL